MPDETQQLVAGRYRLERSLGAGGTGRVWAAEDTLLGRPVAVKSVDLRAHGAEDGLRARVLREARAAARIDHPGSVRVFDVVEGDDTVHVVMELVEAPDLAQVVAERGALPAEEVARIGLDVLGALEAAHASGIVHRDVKPHNVMVLPDGRAKLADFGIASVKDDPGLTATGMVLGTPRYMSPEQARGEQAGAPADLWGLGALLYFAVEGEPPFDRGATLATLNAVLHDEPRPMARAAALAPVLGALLDKDPTRRPSAGEARRRLADLTPEETTRWAAAPPAPASADRTAVLAATPAAAPAPGPAPSRPTRTDRGWLVALAVVGVVALLAAFALAMTRDDGGDQTAGDTEPGTEPEDAEPAPPDTTEAPPTTATPTTAPPAATDGRPEGVPGNWVAHDGDGWRIWHPPDWEPRTSGTTTDLVRGNGDYLRIDRTDDPGDDAVAAWERQEEALAGRYDDYRRLRLESADYRGWEAAIWEYTYAGQRAANLGFVVDDRGYALNLVAAAQRWDSLGEQWTAFQAAFEPTAGGGGGGGDDDDDDDDDD